MESYQTYTPDTITIDSDAEPFRIKGTIWNGRKLHELYREAYTPWEWQPKLMQHATAAGDASAFRRRLITPRSIFL